MRWVFFFFLFHNCLILVMENKAQNELKTRSNSIMEQNTITEEVT